MTSVVHRLWSLEAPSWEVQYDTDCISLVPPDCEAALQISTYRKKAGPVETSDREQFVREARSQSGGVAERSVKCGDFEGISVEYADAKGEVHWIRWWLWRTGTHLFVTWNAERPPSAEHRARIEAVLSSLTAREPSE